MTVGTIFIIVSRASLAAPLYLTSCVSRPLRQSVNLCFSLIFFVPTVSVAFVDLFDAVILSKRKQELLRFSPELTHVYLVIDEVIIVALRLAID